MTASGRVECDRCGKKVRLRKDGAVPEHDYTRTTYGSKWRVASRERVRCDQSGKAYPRHVGSFHCVGVERTWVAECRCGESWTGPEYDTVDRAWAEHAGVTPFAERLAAERAAACEPVPYEDGWPGWGGDGVDPLIGFPGSGPCPRSALGYHSYWEGDPCRPIDECWPTKHAEIDDVDEAARGLNLGPGRYAVHPWCDDSVLRLRIAEGGEPRG